MLENSVYCNVNVEYIDVFVDREQKDYVSLSFDTISAVGSNAAVIHYRCTITHSAVLPSFCS